MNKQKLLALLLTTSTVLGNETNAFAATEYVDSVGSVAGDITNSVKTGQDTYQSQESEYQSGSEGTNEASVYATKQSTFTTTIPKTLVLGGGKINKVITALP